MEFTNDDVTGQLWSLISALQAVLQLCPPVQTQRLLSYVSIMRYSVLYGGHYNLPFNIFNVFQVPSLSPIPTSFIFPYVLHELTLANYNFSLVYHIYILRVCRYCKNEPFQVRVARTV